MLCVFESVAVIFFGLLVLTGHAAGYSATNFIVTQIICFQLMGFAKAIAIRRKSFPSLWQSFELDKRQRILFMRENFEVQFLKFLPKVCWTTKKCIFFSIVAAKQRLFSFVRRIIFFFCEYFAVIAFLTPSSV